MAESFFKAMEGMEGISKVATLIGLNLMRNFFTLACIPQPTPLPPPPPQWPHTTAYPLFKNTNIPLSCAQHLSLLQVFCLPGSVMLLLHLHLICPSSEDISAISQTQFMTQQDGLLDSRLPPSGSTMPFNWLKNVGGIFAKKTSCHWSIFLLQISVLLIHT
jgi:hypothetical protein